MTDITFTKDLAQQFLSSNEQFPINFDDAWKWMEYSRKDVAKRAFMSCGFIEGIDYHFRSCAEVVNRSQGGGIQPEAISLTTECFKQWAMMSGTDKGKEIRLYFLECERIAKQVTAIPIELTNVLINMQQQLASLATKQEKLETVELENKVLSEQLNDTTHRVYYYIGR